MVGHPGTWLGEKNLRSKIKLTIGIILGKYFLFHDFYRQGNHQKTAKFHIILDQLYV